MGKKSVRVEFKGKALCDPAEVAKSFWAKAKGLMLRKSLGEGEGLLMEFQKEGRPGIWMLLMRFPIDIIFLDSHFRVVGLHENIPPAGWRPSSWRVYYPDMPARYVLEVRAGVVKKSGVETGSYLGKT